MASTLANAGVCPITMDKVGVTATFKPHLYIMFLQVYSQPAVRDTLALMHTCGMYDLSGEFSFHVSSLHWLDGVCNLLTFHAKVSFIFSHATLTSFHMFLRLVSLPSLEYQVLL